MKATGHEAVLGVVAFVNDVCRAAERRGETFAQAQVIDAYWKVEGARRWLDNHIAEHQRVGRYRSWLADMGDGNGLLVVQAGEKRSG